MQAFSFDLVAIMAIVSITVPIVVIAITALSESLASSVTSNNLVMPKTSARVTSIHKKVISDTDQVTRLAA